MHVPANQAADVPWLLGRSSDEEVNPRGMYDTVIGKPSGQPIRSLAMYVLWLSYPPTHGADAERNKKGCEHCNRGPERHTRLLGTIAHSNILRLLRLPREGQSR